MATAEKTQKTGSKRGNIFSRIGKFFKNMWHELKKVTWPSKKDVISYSIVVFVFMLIMGVIIGVIDFGSGSLIKLIIS